MSPPIEGLELRPFVDTDRNYVISSWLKSYAGKSRDGREYDKLASFYEDYGPIVCGLVDSGSIMVAAFEDLPDAIIGWFCSNNDLLHYVHVKPRWRRMGVARWMLSGAEELPLTYTHRTADSGKCPVPEKWEYRRFRIWRKAA